MSDEVTGSAPPVDALVRVWITDDLLEAHLFIDPPANGGKAADAEMIDEQLEKAGVCYGIDEALIQKLKASPVYSREFIAARGLAPEAGTDGSIQYYFEIIKNPHPKVRPDGTVDYRDLGLIANAVKGQLLCTITPPTPGKPGRAVTGMQLVQTRGRPVPSPAGKNTVLNEDGTELRAAIDGQIVVDNNYVHVIENFTVPHNVDSSTGNIKFVGNVKVYGDVKEGFAVEAEGSVDICGKVEGGCVTAGKDIYIRRGVVGMERSRIVTKGNLTTTFLENCEVDAAGQIRAESIMNSNVRCGQTIELIGIRAKLVGGVCMAGKNIVANTIGTQNHTQGLLQLGADPAVITRYAKLQKEMDEIRETISKLEQAIKLLEQYEAAGRLSPKKQRMLENSRLSHKDFCARLQAATAEKASIDATLSAGSKGRVICRGTIYPGVKIVIGHASFEPDTPLNAVEFYNKDDAIRTAPASPY